MIKIPNFKLNKLIKSPLDFKALHDVSDMFNNIYNYISTREETLNFKIEDTHIGIPIFNNPEINMLPNRSEYYNKLKCDIINSYYDIENKLILENILSIPFIRLTEYNIDLLFTVLNIGRNGLSKLNRFGLYLDNKDRTGIIIEVKPKINIEQKYVYSHKQGRMIKKEVSQSFNYDEAYINSLIEFLDTNKILSIVVGYGNLDKTKFNMLLLFELDNVNNLTLNTYEKFPHSSPSIDDMVDPDFTIPIFTYPSISMEPDEEEPEHPNEPSDTPDAPPNEETPPEDDTQTPEKPGVDVPPVEDNPSETPNDNNNPEPPIEVPDNSIEEIPSENTEPDDTLIEDSKGESI